MKWNRINKDSPCPICGRVKFCMVNDNGSAVLCTKVSSNHVVGSAGWLHVLDENKNEVTLERASEFGDLFATFQSNVSDGMVEVLSEQLGVTEDSIDKLGIGYFPGECAWVWPEMDEAGTIIGLLKLFPNRKKYMQKGSARGLTYQHPLPNSDKPYIIVEGGSDVLAAMDMGYVGVGRPSSLAGCEMLEKLLAGKDVIVVGENDEAGVCGMSKVAMTLQGSCKSVKEILPPAKHKDLRDWHPTAAEFELWMEQNAKERDSKVIDEVIVWELAKRWLEETKSRDGEIILKFLNGNWYEYDGTCYKETGGKDIPEIERDIYGYFSKFFVRKQVGKTVVVENLNPRKYFIEEMKHAARAIVSISPPQTGPTELFHINKKHVIDLEKTVVFRNGLYNIDTELLEPLSPEVFTTSTMPFDFNPKAKYDFWDGIVYSFFKGEQESHDLLQEWFGYNLIASNFMQQMLMLYGVRNSGKSTVLRAMQALLGPERCTPFSLRELTSRFGLSSLVHKYAALISEDRSSKQVDGELVLQNLKKIIGRDSVLVERKYCDAFEASLFCKFTYAGNDLPIFRDDSKAMLRRFNILYFGRDFTLEPENMDKSLDAKISRNVQGIANWSLVGLCRLLENGEFSVPPGNQKHLDDFKELGCSLEGMIEEYCELDPEYTETVSALHELHKIVYSDWGLKQLGRPLFSVRLRSIISNSSRCWKVINGVSTRCISGIRIKPEFRRLLGG